MSEYTDYSSTSRIGDHPYEVVVRHHHGGQYTLHLVHVVGVGDRKDSDRSYPTREAARSAGDTLAALVIERHFRK